MVSHTNSNLNANEEFVIFLTVRYENEIPINVYEGEVI